mgnify:CR=1 FL=1
MAHFSSPTGVHPTDTQGAVGNILLQVAFGDTEGAQGVLNCPLGNTVLFEPVSVVTLLHPIIVLRYHTILCQPVAAWSAAEVLGRSAAATVYRSEWRVRHHSYTLPTSRRVVNALLCATSGRAPCRTRPALAPLTSARLRLFLWLGPLWCTVEIPRV